MKILLIILLCLAVVLAGLFIWTRVQAAQIEARFPPVGTLARIDGHQTHFLDQGSADNGIPPVLVVHGASGNLNDQRGALSAALEGKTRAIFIDRPGHGYSELGDATDPGKQAARYLGLLDHLNIDRVILAGHSLGSASVAAFAVLYPERVAGLVFMAPATHPWPGGVTWYYDVASTPVIGQVFTETLVLPAGRAGVDAGVQNVFAPNTPPDDYARKSALELVFRPHVFRNNARDVAGLNAFVREFSPRYAEITAPTVIITGDEDDVVAPEIHSEGLKRDIAGSELIVLSDTGHKPDYIHTQVVVDAIERIARDARRAAR